MSNFLPKLIIHGGAWDIPDAEIEGHLSGVKLAAEIGWSILQAGRSALDAIEAAIRSLEDDPAFDAGRGAWLNSAGEIELDAIIMNGADLSSGAVAAVQHIRNPISLARLVMDRSPHALIVGKGAAGFAQAQGIMLVDETELLTGQELERWRSIKALPDYSSEAAFVGDLRPHGTVGAVAIDVQGHIACGTSTGGTPNKLQGRVGDSPLIGCGAYADDFSAGASATGWGESIMKVVLCKSACDFVAHGLNAQAAAEKAIELLAQRAAGAGGLIVIDRAGNIGCAYNTPKMARAWVENDRVIAKVDY
ncbi:MAG TPA: isoaspartyl peptidase/L-asparaginase [Anaerolineae bacterium]|nr:isoaspartyl peptidase/L-asparaginase [Anaerolineae bacterium]